MCLSLKFSHVFLKLYLGPASGTQQRTGRSHSSQTPRPDSDGDTFLHPPGHGGRTEESGSHSNTGLQPELPVISPDTESHHKNTTRCTYTLSLEKHKHYLLTLSVHMSTHLSTDMFWMTALKGRATVTFSGRRKHPLKMALPSEKTREHTN